MVCRELAKATATSDSRVLEMMRDHFIQFVTGRPTVAISMISEMGKRLRATNDLVTTLASKNVNVEMEEQLSFGDRLADKVADFVGSWTFVIYFFAGLLLWILLNVLEWLFRPFDAYPFVFLNLVTRSGRIPSSASYHDEPESRAKTGSSESGSGLPGELEIGADASAAAR